MNLKCVFGIHDWSGCKCSNCGRARDVNHDWTTDCEECCKCGKTRDGCHDWTADCEKCRKCGKTRDVGHDWTPCVCRHCQKSSHKWGRKIGHDGSCSALTCTVCGVTTYDWAEWLEAMTPSTDDAIDAYLKWKMQPNRGHAIQLLMNSFSHSRSAAVALINAAPGSVRLGEDGIEKAVASADMWLVTKLFRRIKGGFVVIQVLDEN